jgi:hypothetical protein
VFASGGHNVVAIGELDHPRRSYRISTRERDGRYIGSNLWREQAPPLEGS